MDDEIGHAFKPVHGYVADVQLPSRSAMTKVQCGGTIRCISCPRLAGDHSSATGPTGLAFSNQGLSASVAALKAIDFGRVTVSAGIDVGAIALRQVFSSATTFGAEPPGSLPFGNGSVRSAHAIGLQFGALLQLDIPLGSRTHFRAEVAELVNAYPKPDYVGGRRYWGTQQRLTIGGGFTF